MTYTEGRGIVTTRRDKDDPTEWSHTAWDTSGLVAAFDYPVLLPEEQWAQYVRRMDCDCVERKSGGTHTPYTLPPEKWQRTTGFHLCRECDPQLELTLNA